MVPTRFPPFSTVFHPSPTESSRLRTVTASVHTLSFAAGPVPLALLNTVCVYYAIVPGVHILYVIV